MPINMQKDNSRMILVIIVLAVLFLGAYFLFKNNTYAPTNTTVQKIENPKDLDKAAKDIDNTNVESVDDSSLSF